jgi:hypothetical protein
LTSPGPTDLGPELGPSKGLAVAEADTVSVVDADAASVVEANAVSVVDADAASVVETVAVTVSGPSSGPVPGLGLRPQGPNRPWLGQNKRLADVEADTASVVDADIVSVEEADAASFVDADIVSVVDDDAASAVEAVALSGPSSGQRSVAVVEVNALLFVGADAVVSVMEADAVSVTVMASTLP